jgi:hypothetical protein
MIREDRVLRADREDMARRISATVKARH